MKLTVLAACLLLSGCGTFQPAPWRTSDTIRQIGVNALIAVDYGQTLDIKNHPELEESNPILGEHPSDRAITGHFLTISILHPLISYMLPHGMREWWQYGSMVYWSAVIYHNHQLGVKIDF